MKMKTDMCKSESPQSHERRVQSIGSSKACSKPIVKLLLTKINEFVYQTFKFANGSNLK